MDRLFHKSLTRWFGGFAVVSGADLLDQVLVVLSVKRHGSMNQCVQQDAQRPAVHLRASVRPAVHDLRGGVQRTAAERLQEFIPLVQVRQAKVRDLKNRARFGSVLLMLRRFSYAESRFLLLSRASFDWVFYGLWFDNTRENRKYQRK